MRKCRVNVYIKLEKITLKRLFFIFFFALSITLFAEPQDRLSGEITVWCMGSEGKQIPKLAREFEKLHPGVTINTQAIPWNGAHDRLITSVAGNIAPDVAQLGTTWVPEFAAMGALLPLKERIDSSPRIGTKNFFSSSLSTGMWKDTLFALPWYVDVRVIFYRSDILAEAGWDHYPDNWEELEDMAADLTRDKDGDGQTEQFAINLPARDEAPLLAFIYQSGGRVLDENENVVFDSPETRRALAFYKSFFKKGYTPRAETGQMDQFQAFKDGYFLSWLTGPWMVGEYERRLPDLKGKWKTALVPGKKTRASFLGGSNLAIFRNSKNPELAWAFVEFMSLPKTQERWYEITGDLPAVKAAWGSPALSGDETWEVFREQITHARPVPSVETWESMAEAIKNGMENMIIGDMAPETVSVQIHSELERIMNSRRTGKGNLASLGAPLGILFLIITGIAAVYLASRFRKKIHGGKEWQTALLFLFPVIAHLTIFIFIPILASLFLSFTDFDIYSIGDWRRTNIIGVSNYARLLSDPLFWRSVLNTGYFIIAAGPLTIMLALGTAMLLNKRSLPMRGFFRAGNFLPVVTPLVAVAVVWRWIYSPRYGLLNWLMGILGFPDQTWLADPQLAMPCLIVMAVWKNFGYSMVIFLAGLQSIPPNVYEAASIDGAGPWNTFKNVTLPLLKPTTIFVTIITTIGYMQFFAEPYVMTDMGGPQNRTLSVVLYLYKEGFKFFHLGYASAMAYTLCLAIALLSLFQLKLAREKGGSKI